MKLLGKYLEWPILGSDQKVAEGAIRFRTEPLHFRFFLIMSTFWKVRSPPPCDVHRVSYQIRGKWQAATLGAKDPSFWSSNCAAHPGLSECIPVILPLRKRRPTWHPCQPNADAKINLHASLNAHGGLLGTDFLCLCKSTR